MSGISCMAKEAAKYKAIVKDSTESGAYRKFMLRFASMWNVLQGQNSVLDQDARYKDLLA